MAATDHLSPDQFWEHEPEPGVAYHVSSPEHRESIEKTGLRPSGAYRALGQPGGVYLFHSLKGPTAYQREGDLWKVDTRGLEGKMETDRSMEHFDIPASSVPHSVARRRLTRIGERTPDGVVLHGRT